VPSAEPIVYADSSALVKLVIDEPESDELESYLDAGPVIATSRLALVEVPRATVLADPAPAVQDEVAKLLDACLLVEVTADVLAAAARLASRTVRTLDAIHLASAVRIGADELVAYDRRLLAAAAAHGLSTAQPGLTGRSARRG
jgi:predicted nucleic acid-binding protein